MTRTALHATAAAWDRYWFRGAPLLDLAVCRILIVGIQLWLLMPPDGWLASWHALAKVPAELFDPLPALHVLIAPIDWNLRPSVEMLQWVYWATLGTGGLALIGLFTRPSLIAYAAGNVFLTAYRYSYGDFHHPEAPIVLALVILALGPSGGALSVDALRKRRSGDIERTSPFARWPLLLIQWMLALVYLSAFYMKLRNGGLDWLNGYTLQYYLVQDGLRHGSELGLWFGSHHGLVTALSWFTVLVEGTFFLAVIFPPLAWFYLPAAAALHIGVELTMRAPFSQWIVLYAAFVPWSRLNRWRKSAFG